MGWYIVGSIVLFVLALAAGAWALLTEHDNRRKRCDLARLQADLLCVRAERDQALKLAADKEQGLEACTINCNSFELEVANLKARTADLEEALAKKPTRKPKKTAEVAPVEQGEDV